MSGATVVRLADVTVRFEGGRTALAGIDLEVRAGEHWVLLGPNGAGKTTLLGLIGGWRHPSSGTAEVLGGRFGRTDLTTLRRRIGYAGPRLRVPGELAVLDYVLTGHGATVQPRLGGYPRAVVDAARTLLDVVGLAPLAAQPVRSCSTGEVARARVARALLPEPDLLLLDEPVAGLDLPGREDLREALDSAVGARPQLASVTTVHHLEEVPGIVTCVALLTAGRLLATGPVALLGNEGQLSACFGRPVRSGCVDGRWYARAVGRVGESAPAATEPLGRSPGGRPPSPPHR